MRTQLRNYTRWLKGESGYLHADILAVGTDDAPSVTARPELGTVHVHVSSSLSPDEARLIGVRIIEAAALADGDRAIRDCSRKGE